MRIALAIGGHLRTWRDCLKSPHLQELLNDSRVDTYVTCWDSCFPKSSCYRDTVSNEKALPNEIYDRYRAKGVRIVQDRDFWDESCDYWNQRHWGKFENYMSMWYIVRDSVLGIPKGYDYVIRMRPDTFLLSDVELRHDTVFMETENYLSDIYFAGPEEDVRKIADYVPRAPLVGTYPNWHENLFTQHVKSTGVKYEMDSKFRLQILREDRKKWTVGFLEKGKYVFPEVTEQMLR